MSLYIRLFTDFWTHRKTMKLKTMIGNDAYWIMPRLWSYAAENQIDGDFSSYDSEVLCEILGCSKLAPTLLQSLTTSGFMVKGKLKDWEDHNRFHTTNSFRARKAASARHDETKKKVPKKKEDSEREREQATPKLAPSMLQAGIEPKTHEDDLHAKVNGLLKPLGNKARPPSPVARVFLDNWRLEFEKILVDPYVPDRFDSFVIDDLISIGFTTEKLMSIAKKAWSNQNSIYCKQARTIKGFGKHLNNIIAELNALDGKSKRKDIY